MDSARLRFRCKLLDQPLRGVWQSSFYSEAIKDGKLAATFIYPFCASEGVMYAYKIAKGEQVPEQVILKSIRVDASDVDQYLGNGF